MASTRSPISPTGPRSSGRAEFEHRHAGAVWRFRNAGNLGAFAADPEVYVPRFGGYDPVGVGRGVPAAGDPRIWMIVEQRLYLFQSAESRAVFALDSERLLATADEAWPIGPAHARALSRRGSASRIDGGGVAPGDETGDPQTFGVGR